MGHNALTKIYLCAGKPDVPVGLEPLPSQRYAGHGRTMKQTSSRYGSIQIARAAAALMVIIGHSPMFAPDGALPKMPGWASFGFAGVDLFFVISGFIISLVIDRPQVDVVDFLKRRAFRILPFYWLFTLGWIALLFLGSRPMPGVGEMLASALVIPQHDLPVLNVGWSLEHELIFYAIVAALLLVRRAAWLPVVLSVLFGVGVVLHVVLPATRGADLWDWHVFSLYHFQFLLGVLLYRWRAKVAKIDWRALLAPGCTLFLVSSTLVVGLQPDGHVPTNSEGLGGITRVVLFGIASALMIGGLISLEAARPESMKTALGRLGNLLGDSSYALYLAHPLIYAVLGAAIAWASPPSIALWPILIFSWTSAVAFACTFYRFAEQPFLEWSSHTRRTVPVSDAAI